MLDPKRVSGIDVERFGLRALVERLTAAGEVEVVKEPVSMSAMASRMYANGKAVLFLDAGPEHSQVVGNLMASRRRLALSLEVGEKELLAAINERLELLLPPVEVDSADSPVHQVVLTGDQADLTRLPVHLQHELDAAPYISASLDFATMRDTGWTNVGCRRMMLRGRRDAGVDLNAPSDLRNMYLDAVSRGERLPVAFTVGSHPADFIASCCLVPPADEMSLLGAIRGAPVPVVRCKTIDVLVPADAEIVLEGYLDDKGFVEPEGPYGEFLGYYGVQKKNPVFHLTAVTHRRNPLFQTVTISGDILGCTDNAQLVALRTEAAVWAALKTAIREPVAVYANPDCGGMFSVRVSMRQRYPGESRNAIAAVLGSNADVKHVYVMDEDIDVFNDRKFEWALATRFQADRDLVVSSGYRTMPLDPSLRGRRTGAKAGFDLTVPFGSGGSADLKVPKPPAFGAHADGPRAKSARDALSRGPMTFIDIMKALQTDDGRDVVRELEALRAEGCLVHQGDGRYAIAGAERS